MATRYYDDILVAKIKKWIPDNSPLRVLKPDEAKRMLELKADDKNDQPLALPIIAISRNNDIELSISTKNPMSYDGLRLSAPEDQSSDLSALKGEKYTEALKKIPEKTIHFNAIPIELGYQIDIYTKTYEEGDEYVRALLFKLINNPVMKVQIPYNGVDIEHIANIKVLPTVSDTSAISERLFPGQFTRWSIQLEIQDAFLFSIPYRTTWKIILDEETEEGLGLEISNKINESGEIEPLDTGRN